MVSEEAGDTVHHLGVAAAATLHNNELAIPQLTQNITYDQPHGLIDSNEPDHLAEENQTATPRCQPDITSDPQQQGRIAEPCSDDNTPSNRHDVTTSTQLDEGHHQQSEHEHNKQDHQTEQPEPDPSDQQPVPCEQDHPEPQPVVPDTSDSKPLPWEAHKALSAYDKEIQKLQRQLQKATDMYLTMTLREQHNVEALSEASYTEELYTLQQAMNLSLIHI